MTILKFGVDTYSYRGVEGTDRVWQPTGQGGTAAMGVPQDKTSRGS